jgi:competence protein ComEA
MLKHWMATLMAVCVSAFATLAQAAVDVNKADQAALESVKGIGPAMSTRLLEERKKTPFKDWPDLIERVKGVGPGNAAKFSEAGLTINGAGYTRGDAAPAADKRPAKTEAKPAKSEKTAQREKTDAPAEMKTAQK